MQQEVYTQFPLAQNSALQAAQPQRAGELLPELFRRYVERMIAARGEPAALVDDQSAASLGISIVAVKSAGCTVAGLPGAAPAIAAPAATRS